MGFALYGHFFGATAYRGFAFNLGAGLAWRRAVGFTPDAASYFRDLFARTLAMATPGGQLQDLGGYAAKMAERTARYACVLHTFNDLPGLISSETLCHAELIVLWHTRQFQHLLHAASPETQAMHDAQTLEQQLQFAAQRGEWVLARDLQRYCPNDWSRTRCTRALGALERTGRACVRVWRGKTKYVQLAGTLPMLLPSAPMQVSGPVSIWPARR